MSFYELYTDIYSLADKAPIGSSLSHTISKTVIGTVGRNEGFKIYTCIVV